MSTTSMIRFDSSDWSSIRDTIDKINKVGCMQVGKTEDDETIIFDVSKDDDGNDVLKTEVFQHNGWIRTNYYNPVEFTIDELYKKDK